MTVLLLISFVIYLPNASTISRLGMHQLDTRIAQNGSPSPLQTNTTLSSATGTNSSTLRNSTILLKGNTTASGRVTANTTNLEAQIRSMSEVLNGMSSKVDSLREDSGSDRLIAISALVLAILAIIAAIAVAQRADSLYKQAAQPAKPD